MNQDAIYFVLSSSVRIGLFTDSAILLDVAQGRYFGLNTLGASICSALQNGATLQQLIQIVRTLPYPTDETAADDIRKFLNELEKRELCHAEVRG